VSNWKPVYNIKLVFEEYVLIFSSNLDPVKLEWLKENTESVVAAKFLLLWDGRYLKYCASLGVSDCLWFLLLAKFSARRIVSNN
jgi:hypothetical protein